MMKSRTRNSMGKRIRGSKRFDDLVQHLLDPYDIWAAGEGKWRSRCPIHKGSSNHSSFRINRYGKWICFSCGAGGEMENLLMEMQGLSYKAALTLLDIAPGVRHRLIDIPELPSFEERGKPQLGYDLLPEREIVLFLRHCPQLLLNRGFSRGSLKEWEIGYDTKKHQIVIPVRDAHANLVGVTYRSDFEGSLTSGGREIKYWHDHFDKAKHLYGFHKWKGKKLRRLHLVEGQLDAIRMWQLGHAACAVMGSWLDRRQQDILVKHARCKELVLMFDYDEAGHKATKQALRMLTKTRFGRGLKVAQYPTSDPGELTEQHKIKYKGWAALLMKGR